VQGRWRTSSALKNPLSKDMDEKEGHSSVALAQRKTVFPRRRKSRAALNLSRYQNMSNLCQRPAVTFRSHMSAMTQCRASYYELCLESGRDLSSIFTSALTISSLRNYIWVGEAIYRQTLLRREKEEEPANRLFMPSALIPTAYVSLPPSLPTYTIATFDPNNDLLFSRDPDRPHTDIRP